MIIDGTWDVSHPEDMIVGMAQSDFGIVLIDIDNPEMNEKIGINQ